MRMTANDTSKYWFGFVFKLLASMMSIRIYIHVQLLDLTTGPNLDLQNRGGQIFCRRLLLQDKKCLAEFEYKIFDIN